MRFGKQGGWQGALDMSRPDRPVFPYQRALKALVQTIDQIRTYLSVGVGTGTSLTSVQSAHPEAKLFGIELDERVIDVAIQYFNAPSHREADYWVGDGTAFLLSRSELDVDLVFIDAYMPKAIYQPVLDPAVVEALERRVGSSGVVVYNVITQHYHTSALATFLQTAQESFRSVVDWPVGVPWTSQNRLLICTQRNDFSQYLRQHLQQSSALSPLERIVSPMRIRNLSRGNVL